MDTIPLDDDIPDFLAIGAQGTPVTDLGTTEGLITIAVDQAVQQALPAAQPHEEARIKAISPQGFEITLITRRQNPGDLIETVGKMLGWLSINGYKGIIEYAQETALYEYTKATKP